MSVPNPQIFPWLPELPTDFEQTGGSNSIGNYREHGFSAIYTPASDLAYDNNPGQAYEGQLSMQEPASAIVQSAPRKDASCPSGYSCVSDPDNSPSSWAMTPSGLAGELNDPSYHDLNLYFTAAGNGTDPSGNPVVPDGELTIPKSCAPAGDPPTCAADLTAAGFPTPSTTTVADDQAVPADGAGNIVQTQPSAGSHADADTVVVINENPSPLPIVIPAPNANETYSSFVARLQALGLVGAISETTSDGSQDQSGSYDVTATQPVAGSQVSPSTAVQVSTSPASADGTDPSGSTGTGGASAPTTPTLPGINIPSAPTPCNVFPFGLPCWISNQLGGFSAPAVAPSVKIAIPQIFGGGSTDIDLGATIFGVQLDSLMQYVRPVLLISAAIGLMVWLAGMAMGGSTGGGSGGEEE